VVGLLAFSGGMHRSTRHLVRLAAEMLVAFAAFFGGWALVAGLASHQSVGAILGPVVSIAYPLGDLVTAMIVVVAFRQATRDRVSLGLVLGGILSFTLADSSFAYETATKSFGFGNGLDSGWVLGYLLVALGAIWAIQQRRLADNSRAAAAAWALASPSLATVGAPGLAIQQPATVRAPYLKPSTFTPRIADHIVNSVGVFLIISDAGLCLYDLHLVVRTPT